MHPNHVHFDIPTSSDNDGRQEEIVARTYNESIYCEYYKTYCWVKMHTVHAGEGGLMDVQLNCQ